MALVSLEEAKAYLRVDSADEDALIESLLLTSEVLAKDIGRLSDETWADVVAEPTEEDTPEILRLRGILCSAILYALGYLFEHREEADHHAMTLTLRSLLFAVREGVI